MKTTTTGIPLLLLVLLAAPAALAADDSEKVLADWKTWPAPEAKVSGAAAARGPDGWLVLRVQPGPGRAGVVLAPEAGTWDLEALAEVAVPVRNLGPSNVRVILRVDDPATRKATAAVGARANSNVMESVISPGPDPVWLVVALGDRKPAAADAASKFLSMVAPPPEFVRRGTVAGAQVAAVSVFVPNPAAAQSVAVGPVVARGRPAPLAALPPEKMFPFIDAYGQFIHRDWPGKIHADADFAARRRAEDADLAAHARPADWDRYGGWAAGPQLKATGFFRAEKIAGVWWLVDPEGRLFWSHGVVRVGTRIRVGTEYHGTPLPDRETYFRLPPKDSPLGAFFGTQPQSTRGYYVGREGHAVYDFLEANLFRKYGPAWRTDYAARAQSRLAAWGLNTIANSSDPVIYTRRATPYTAVAYSAPLGRSEFRLAGSGGNWGKLPDPFDPGWRQLLDRTLQTDLKESLGDPWCLGFFVDNELAWGDTCHLAEASLASPAAQPAKRVFAEDLKKKYATIEALNAAWGTPHASWDALLAATALPDRKRAAARADLEAFSERYLDAYFGGCRDAVKAASPNHMYLGCRFASGGNALVMQAAAKTCDVVSINRYAHTIETLALPAGLDRPIVIGEFHFGAIDAAPFGVALVKVANAADRGRAYGTYVESALANPAVVGTHWFQYYDQPTSGRFDGENYHAGLLDIADTPYAEMVAACRRMGAMMYALRSRSFKP